MTVSEQLDAAESHVRANLLTCCREILDWHKTAILCDGEVRTAAGLLTDPVFNNVSLVHIENAVKRCAMEKIASTN
jgi:hypothetical protein